MEELKLKNILAGIKKNNNEVVGGEQFLKAIEDKWVDPTPNLIEGIFQVDQTNICQRCLSKKRSTAKEKVVVYDYRSLYLFHFEGTFRKQLVNLTESTSFDSFIILLIFINSIVLAVYDYNDRDDLTGHNQTLELIGKFITVLFTIEMVLKIVAQGFIVHKNGYLRDTWNKLDFFVVITGILELVDIIWIEMRSLRALRVLRPLRSLKSFPKLKQLISSLISSLNQLFNTVVFMLFVFMLFGILGIQQFGGSMYRRCRFTEEPLPDGTWPYDEDANTLCSPDGNGMVSCPADQFCKEPLDAGLGSDFDEPQHQTLIYYNILGFNNLAWAMLTILQMITLESWTIVMYNLMDSNSWWMSVIFCVLIVVIGSFFMLNVILAVLADALQTVEKVQEQNQSVKLLAIRQSFDRADKQKAKKLGITIEEYYGQQKQSQAVQETTTTKDRKKRQDSQIGSLLKDVTVESQSGIQLTEIAVDQGLPSAAEVAGADPNSMMLLPPPQKELKQNSVSSTVDLFRPDQKEGDEREKRDQSNKPDDPQRQQQTNHVDAYNVIYDSSNISDFGSARSEFSFVVKDEIPERAKKNLLFFVCYKVSTHWLLTLFITVLIVANTLVLAQDKYPEDPDTTEINEALNQFFTWAFLAEMLIKLLGLGFKEYARDSFNIFDAIIVVLSMLDLILTASTNGETDTGEVSAFRGIRLLRIFKLARSWTNFRETLSTIYVTIKDVCYFSVLLIMFMFIFSLLGMEWFGYKVAFDSNDRPIEIEAVGLISDSEYPRPNFNTIGMGFVSIFAIAIGDDWNYLMALAYRAEGEIAFGFFPIVFIFMNLILLNLFLAMLLQNYATKDNDKNVQGAEIEADEKTFKKLTRCLHSFFCCLWWPYCKSKKEGEDDSVHYLGDDISSSSYKVQEKARTCLEKEDNSDDSCFESSGPTILKEPSKNSQVRNIAEPEQQEQSTVNLKLNFQKQRSQDISLNQVGAPLQTKDVNEGQSADSVKNPRSKTLRPDFSQTGDQSGRKDLWKSKGGSREQREYDQIKSLMSQLPDDDNPETQKPKRGENLAEIKKKKDTLLQQQRLHLYTNKNMSIAKLKKMMLHQKYGGDKKKIKMKGKSFGLLSPQNWLRKVCFSIVKHSQYDNVVLLLIAISTILLILDNPNLDQNGETATVLHYFDYVLTSLFTIECLINLILFGFLCNGKTSYARDPWNVMDMLIVFFSITTIVLAGQGGVDLSILKAFRMLRVLRPLRFLKRNLGLKIQVISLMNAIPGIFNLMMIATLVLMLFGIQAVGFLKGKLYYCETVNVPEYLTGSIKNKWDCINYGGEWVKPENHFDDVFSAMRTLFGMSTTEGWLEVMWSTVDTTEIDLVPQRNNNPAYILFFSAFMVLGSLFILNLFVGVVISVFNLEKEKLSHNNLLTKNQDEYCEVLIKCYSLRPQRSTAKTGSLWRDGANRFARSNVFEVFIFVCICLNTVVLSLSWYGMDQKVVDTLEILNYIFTMIYTFEMIIKLVGFGKEYFRDGWNIFDFLIVISAWLGIFLLQVFAIQVGSISTVIRSFRIARVLKLIKMAKNLQQIFQTFILAINELLNVGALLMLLLFLFAVLGVSLFADVKLQDTMDRHSNFSNFGFAILTLLRVTTGEGWVGIMNDAARQPSVLFSCVKEQTYESKMANGIQGCGTTGAYWYFISFMLIVSLVFLNLFMAIILEGFAASATEQSIRIDEEAFLCFQKHWCTYDPSGTGMINIDKLEDLLMDLIEEELETQKKEKVRSCYLCLDSFIAIRVYTKWKRNLITDEERGTIFKNFENSERRQNLLLRQFESFIRRLEIPTYSCFKQIQFNDTLDSLVKMRFSQTHEHEYKKRIQNIETKKKAGYKLTGLELVERGSDAFWTLTSKEKEEWMETNDPDFQHVINRLENKGKDNNIMKYNFMQQLRQMTGQKKINELDTYIDETPEVEGDEREKVFSSAHYSAGKTILQRLEQRFFRRKLKQEIKKNVHKKNQVSMVLEVSISDSSVSSDDKHGGIPAKSQEENFDQQQEDFTDLEIDLTRNDLLPEKQTEELVAQMLMNEPSNVVVAYSSSPTQKKEDMIKRLEKGDTSPALPTNLFKETHSDPIVILQDNKSAYQLADGDLKERSRMSKKSLDEDLEKTKQFEMKKTQNSWQLELVQQAQNQQKEAIFAKTIDFKKSGHFKGAVSQSHTRVVSMETAQQVQVSLLERMNSAQNSSNLHDSQTRVEVPYQDSQTGGNEANQSAAIDSQVAKSQKADILGKNGVSRNGVKKLSTSETPWISLNNIASGLQAQQFKLQERPVVASARDNHPPSTLLKAAQQTFLSTINPVQGHDNNQSIQRANTTIGKSMNSIQQLDPSQHQLVQQAATIDDASSLAALPQSRLLAIGRRASKISLVSEFHSLPPNRQSLSPRKISQVTTTDQGDKGIPSRHQRQAMISGIYSLVTTNNKKDRQLNMIRYGKKKGTRMQNNLIENTYFAPSFKIDHDVKSPPYQIVTDLNNNSTQVEQANRQKSVPRRFQGQPALPQDQQIWFQGSPVTPKTVNIGGRLPPQSKSMIRAKSITPSKVHFKHNRSLNRTLESNQVLNMTQKGRVAKNETSRNQVRNKTSDAVIRDGIIVQASNLVYENGYLNAEVFARLEESDTRSKGKQTSLQPQPFLAGLSAVTISSDQGAASFNQRRRMNGRQKQQVVLRATTPKQIMTGNNLPRQQQTPSGSSLSPSRQQNWSEKKRKMLEGAYQQYKHI